MSLEIVSACGHAHQMSMTSHARPRWTGSRTGQISSSDTELPLSFHKFSIILLNTTIHISILIIATGSSTGLMRPDAALGTVQFAHFPSNYFLALIPQEDPVKTFDDLAMEREVLAKAVASLNTVRRKGKSNVNVVDVAEDDVGSRLGYIEQFPKKKIKVGYKVQTKLSKRPNPDTTSKEIIIGPVSIDSRDVSIDIGMTETANTGITRIRCRVRMSLLRTSNGTVPVTGLR
ncbi:hypothetical protein C8J57DRAFT_1242819 [Mycena rebaudengoi]|nr:hypothetical protein C8J57DRAFT_1242819 [Mycena rebaudengoi]